MKVRKKPVVVEAEQFFPDKLPWPDGVKKIPEDVPRRMHYLFCFDGNVHSNYEKIIERLGYYIETLEGPFEVTPGDWIITGVNGEKYPCKPDIFEKTYEMV